MLQKLFLTVLIGTLFAYHLIGQSNEPITLTGNVIDGSNNVGLEFATITLYDAKDSTIITGGLTEANGSFILMSSSRQVYAIVEFLSYTTVNIPTFIIPDGQKTYNLGNIKISTDAVALQQVEIIGEKSETEFALDKRVFNVGKDISNRGGSAQDVLDNVPSVTVDVDGGVSLRGNGNVRILIDGRPSGLIGLNGSGGLRSIPANMIERIEVITNPSARYEAEGMSGIINIVLKKDTKGGFNGSFEVSGGWPENYGAGANLNYRKGKTNFFVNYGLNYNNSPSTGYTYQENISNDSVNATYLIRKGYRSRLANSIRTGLDFSITDQQTITATLLYRYSTSDNVSPIRYYDHVFVGNEDRGRFNVPLLSYSERIENEKETSPTLEYTVDYRKKFDEEGKEWKTSIQYSSNIDNEKATYTQAFYTNGLYDYPQFNQRSDNSENQKTILFQSDYVLPINKEGKFETGIRAQLRDIDNDYLVDEYSEETNSFIPLANFTNNFRYNEDVYAAYLIYGNKKDKFSYQGGVRYEYSDIKTELLQTNETNPRKYGNIFPSGHINYEFVGQNQVQVSFARRINRPRFWDLNPFFTFNDNRNINSGNPNINPEFTNSYEISHIKYWESGNIGSSIYWRHTTDVIQRITTFNDDGTTLTMPRNLATAENMGMEFLFAYNPSKWLKLDGNINIFRNIVDDNDENLNLDADSYSWFGRIGSRFSFWKNADFQLRLNYRAPINIPQGQQKTQYIVDVAFSKEIKKNLVFSIAARDLLNSRRRNTEIFADGFYQRVDHQWRRAPIIATFSYRLNMSTEKKKNAKGDSNEMDNFGNGDM